MISYDCNFTLSLYTLSLNGQYSFWFNLSAGVRQCELLSPVLSAVYMDPLTLKLRKLTVGCKIADHIYGCLLYADDIMLLTHSVNAMRRMLSVCE